MKGEDEPTALCQIDPRDWYHFPIEMPVNFQGQGPATIGVDAAKMTYEVWDVLLNTHGSFDHLFDAIKLAIKLNAEMESEEINL